MKNFEFHIPTKVLFGKDTEKQVGKLIKGENCKKVLVHYGSESAKKSGLLDVVYASLKEAGIDYVSLGGVVPNPRLSKVYEGIEFGLKENVDFILAVGGGSVIDSAKAIGYGLFHKDVDVWDIFEGKVPVKGAIPNGCIPTIAAAGSEMSSASVITKEDGALKRSFKDDHGRCKFAILNPALTLTLPDYQTASGCTDILMHAMERYLSTDKNGMLKDALGEALMRTVLYNAKLLFKNPSDYNARAEIMWAGTFAHNDVTGARAVGDWASHQIEHELGGLFDVAHGAGLAAIWGSWARYVYKEDVHRFAQFAVNVLGLPHNFDDPAETALRGIEAMEDFYRSIGMPTSIKELGYEVTDEQIKEMAIKATYFGGRTIGTVKVPKADDIAKIYEMAR